MDRFLSMRTIVVILAVGLTASCGGGGGSSPSPFEITSGPPSNGATGVAYPGFTFIASNGVAPVGWTASGALPPGLSLNAAGQLLGTPSTAGTYSFTVTAADSSSPPHDATTTVSVQISDSMMVISTAPQPPSGTATYPYAGYTFTVASGGSSPFNWAVTAGTVPPGLTLGSDGSLSGSPTSAGSYSFTVTVTDSASTPQRVSAPFTIMVGTPSAPVVSATPAPPSGTVTHPYNGGSTFLFGASGGLAPYTWAVTTGAVPAGLTFGSNGTLSGTPTTAGTVTFTVTATDSAQQPLAGSQAFTVAVNTPGPPVINLTPAPPDAVADNDYPLFGFTASGGYLPLTWAVTAGALPPGLSLATSGLLGGVPTSIGSFPFTVTVTDSAPTPQMNSAPFTVAITAPPPPTIIAGAPPTGTVGTAYPAFAFQATDGYLPLLWRETGALPTGLGVSAGGVLSGTPGEAGQFPIILNVTDSLSRSAPSVPLTVRVSLARAAAGFTLTTGSMTAARSAHTATLLQSGHVLIAGGSDASGPLASAELYDPTNQMFTATSSMTVARSGHTATLLADAALPNSGKILLAGGGSQSAELYDPTAGTFTATGNMVAPHTSQTATLLQNGQVLIAGGATASAELYNPATGTFTATGSMTVSRSAHTATLLLNGQVLIAGGGTATAELYNPATGRFTATGSMLESRSEHTATLLANATLPNHGRVVVAGPDFTAEVFDPTTHTFSRVGSLVSLGAVPADRGMAAFIRNDGTVVVAGGYYYVPLFRSRTPTCFKYGDAKYSLAAAQLFAPESEGFTATAHLNTARYGHAATVLADGTVLVTGGTLGTVHTAFVCSHFHPSAVSAVTTVLASAELYK
ncbi:MAG TPA: putative Ig domain-containing protein [Steroidobacteraceae bacterium]